MTKKKLPQLMQAVATLNSLQEFVKLTEQAKPYLKNIEQLADKLETAKEMLQKAQSETTELKASLERQRQTFLHMFTVCMGISLPEILSIEAHILEERKDADTSIRSTENSEATTEANSSSDSPRRLETTLTESDSEGRDNSGSQT
jgi:hypothetical protein